MRWARKEFKMAAKGVRAKITRMRPTEAVVTAIPRDRDNTDDLYDAEQKVRARFSPFPHPGSKTRKGSFEGNNSSAQGPNNAVTLP